MANFEVRLLFRSSLDCLPFFPFFLESQEVVVFSVRIDFEDFWFRNGDFLYSFSSSYDSESSFSYISAFLFSSSCFNRA